MKIAYRRLVLGVLLGLLAGCGVFKEENLDPHITKVTYSGTCASYDIDVSWEDEDGDVTEIQALFKDSDEIIGKLPLSGKAGTFTWIGSYCNREDGCNYDLVIVDAKGHVSERHDFEISCTAP